MTPQDAQSIVMAGEPCPYDPYDWELYEEARRMVYQTTSLTHENLMEELRNIADNQPLFPGDTVSHAGAAELCRMGLIRRSDDGRGYWVLTDKGAMVAMAPKGVVRDG